MIYNNRGYDSDTFIVSKVIKDIALLPGVGRFCKCGCGRPIEGKQVTKRFNGGQVLTFYRPPPKNKVFVSNNCRWRFFNNGKPSKSHLRASIQIKPQMDDEIPYRLLTIYMMRNNKQEFKITKSNTEIWEFLNKIYKFRTNGEISIVC